MSGGLDLCFRCSGSKFRTRDQRSARHRRWQAHHTTLALIVVQRWDRGFRYLYEIPQDLGEQPVG